MDKDMQDFRNLKVWRKSYDLAVEIHRETRKFPREELYGLTSQLKRASTSIPINLAEGCGREGDNEFARFITYALGSCLEVQTQLMLARDLDYLDRDAYQMIDARREEVRRMLVSLLEKVKQRTTRDRALSFKL